MKSSIVFLLGGILLCGCDGSTGPRVGTESHFLEACKEDSECTPELECIAQRCTVGCSSDSSCVSLPGDAVCLPNPDGTRGSSCALAESAAGGTKAAVTGAGGRAGGAAGAVGSPSTGASADGGAPSDGEVAGGAGTASTDERDAGEGVSGAGGALGSVGLGGSGSADMGVVAGAGAAGSTATVGAAGFASIGGTAGGPDDACQAPASYQLVAAEQLRADLQSYVGQKVAFTSRVQTGTPACTELVCDADRCCNSCIVPLAALSLSLELTDGEVEGVGCSGTNCDYADHCDPAGLLGEHLVWGIVQEFYGSYQLALDGYCP